MSDGIDLGEARAIYAAPAVHSGGVDFTVWRGDLYPMVDLETDIIRALVMATPNTDVIMVDLDMHPERVTGPLGAAAVLLAARDA